MKTIQILSVSILTIMAISCNQKEEQAKIEVHKADEQLMHGVHKMDVEVENDLDPVCGMKTAEHLSDTIQYQGKVYGFCSAGCKETFAENPENFLSKMN